MKHLITIFLVGFLALQQGFTQKLDVNNLNQERLTQLWQKRVMWYHITHGNFDAKKQTINKGVMNAAKYQTLYQMKHKCVTHNCDIDKDDTFLDFEDNRVITGEVCGFSSGYNIKTYKQLINHLFKMYKNSPEHLDIILSHDGKDGYIGFFIKFNKNGSFYNTIEYVI